MTLLTKIPLALTALRACLGPLVLLLAILWPNQIAFGICLTIAFLSDIFDGIIARRLNIATEGLRRLDSIADSIFYVAAAGAAWLLHPQAILDRIQPILVLIALEIVRYVFDYYKYRRETSYHMWSSKLWGIFLFIGFMSLLAFNDQGIFVTLFIYIGILADIEGLAISLTLKKWTHDVPTIFHALRLRAAQANQKTLNTSL
jgi:phosphatidylglycerophosphate synthase